MADKPKMVKKDELSTYSYTIRSLSWRTPSSIESNYSTEKKKESTNLASNERAREITQKRLLTINGSSLLVSL